MLLLIAGWALKGIVILQGTSLHQAPGSHHQQRVGGITLQHTHTLHTHSMACTFRGMDEARPHQIDSASCMGKWLTIVLCCEPRRPPCRPPRGQPARQPAAGEGEEGCAARVGLPASGCRGEAGLGARSAPRMSCRK
jgi:hypothetical protein